MLAKRKETVWELRSLTLPVVFVTGLLVGLGLTWTLRAQQLRTGNGKVLLQTDLVACPGQEIGVALLDVGPGTSGPHYHPGESFTYILDGSETYQLDGGPESTVKSGELLHELPKQIHTTGNSAPVKLLVVRVQPKGSPDTVRVESKRGSKQ